MPTYEYGCTNCKRRFDVVQSFSDAPLATCEVCGGTLKRVFHPVGIVLKGSGFYSTDNRASKTLAAGSKPPEKSDKKDGAAPADSKPTPSPSPAPGKGSDAAAS